MKCLVVTTHPLNNSLCNHLTDKVVKHLEGMKQEVTVEDLYSLNFQPALKPEERESYYSGPYDATRIAQHAENLTEAEALVLVFPTWWYGFPAMLKGWFDRVWAPGIAYDHATDLGAIQPRLTKLKRVLVITTLGSPWWVDRLVMRQPVKRIIKTALLGTCTPKCKLQYLSLYKSEKLEERQVTQFSQRIEHALQQWKN